MNRGAIYQAVRDRSAVTLKAKHVRQYDREFEKLSRAQASMSVLEIGCGTGLFLRYLEHKGYRRIVAVDTDEGLRSVLNDLRTTQVFFGDVFTVLGESGTIERFDRIVLHDVIEHIDVAALFPFMIRLHDLLAPDGKIVVRAPNVTSPWGVKMFFDSFDHVTPITPGRIRELAQSTGYRVDGIYPQQPARLGKRLAQDVLHQVLAGLVAYHPDIWSANLLAVLSPLEKDRRQQ